MATVTHAGQSFTTTPAFTQVFTPVLNDLLVVFVFTTGTAGGATAVSDNNAGGAGTYVQVDVDRTQGANNATITAWVRTALISSATSTTVTFTAAGATGGGPSVERVSGMTRTGASAVRSSGGQSSAAAGTPAPVLSQTPTGTNPVIIGLHTATNGTANQTVRASYTEAWDLGHASPAAGGALQFRSTGEASATLTFGGAAPSQFATLALELDSSAAATETKQVIIAGI